MPAGGAVGTVGFANTKGVFVMRKIKEYGQDVYPFHVKFIFTEPAYHGETCGLAYIISHCKSRNDVAKLLRRLRQAIKWVNEKVKSSSKTIVGIAELYGLIWIACRDWLTVEVTIPYSITYWDGKFRRREKSRYFKINTRP